MGWPYDHTPWTSRRFLLLRLRRFRFTFAVRHAKHFFEAACTSQRQLHAFFAQSQSALLAHLVAQLVARRAAVDHPPHFRRDFHHLVHAHASLKSAVVALRAADALAKRAAGLVAQARIEQ